MIHKARFICIVCELSGQPSYNQADLYSRVDYPNSDKEDILDSITGLVHTSYQR